MELSNKKRTGQIRRIFNLVVVALLATAIFFVWKENNTVAITLGAAMVLLIFASQFVNVNYIFYSSEGGKILIRYYPVISFLKKEYASIEFDQKLLYFAKVKRVGMFSDLLLAIKTSKGIAEYPEVSLTGLSKEEVNLIEQDLNALLKRK